LTNAQEITITGPRNLDGENRWKKFKIKATYLSDGNQWGGRLDFESLNGDPLLNPEQWDSLKKQWELFQEQDFSE
jgi:hypothetical protein